MAIQKYEGVSGVKATLIDGYLKDRSYLLKTAEEVAKEIDALPEKVRSSSIERPYSWNDWDEDALFEYIAYNSRGQFCRNKPAEQKGYVWSEAWLLKPERWENGYTLKSPEKDQSSRRLLIGLYLDCACGDQCLTNVVEKSGLETIADGEYKNIKAFKQDAEQFLDEISLPFQAPCLIARKTMESKGYTLRAFGS